MISKIVIIWFDKLINIIGLSDKIGIFSSSKNILNIFDINMFMFMKFFSIILFILSIIFGLRIKLCFFC